MYDAPTRRLNLTQDHTHRSTCPSQWQSEHLSSVPRRNPAATRSKSEFASTTCADVYKDYLKTLMGIRQPGSCRPRRNLARCQQVVTLSGAGAPRSMAATSLGIAIKGVLSSGRSLRRSYAASVAGKCAGPDSLYCILLIYRWVAMRGGNWKEAAARHLVTAQVHWQVNSHAQHLTCR